MSGGGCPAAASAWGRPADGVAPWCRCAAAGGGWRPGGAAAGGRIAADALELDADRESGTAGCARFIDWDGEFGTKLGPYCLTGLKLKRPNVAAQQQPWTNAARCSFVTMALCSAPRDSRPRHSAAGDREEEGVRG